MIKRSERIKNEDVLNNKLKKVATKEKIKTKIFSLAFNLFTNVAINLGTFVLRKYFGDEVLEFIAFVISLFK